MSAEESLDASPKLQTSHLKPQTLNPKTQNPNPRTQSPKPKTQNPKLETQTPNPETKIRDRKPPEPEARSLKAQTLKQPKSPRSPRSAPHVHRVAQHNLFSESRFTHLE